ncbi:phosphatidylinositol kinase [Rhizobium sp. Root73]|uniref:type II toxin-antitoxin system HipA family toxin n=1 Tax=unclassified Rhizobium TaxID=2613769 RepID=UPI00072605FC|nr:MULTISPECIES: type II toxin-antitoxin system HipA family toxin [unclassified Rhizobium]KQY00467.1 phosphatidylinositol kinase [Rhizobium sp. Root1334]KRC11652.1 phosphatidylinositol kinase [Rhizobium sp. Root73]
MAKESAVLAVRLVRPDQSMVRVGTLSRDSTGASAFFVDEAYFRDDQRPIVSLSWYVPGDEEATRRRLAGRGDKIGLNGYLPPWFSGLLPEGALRDLVMSEMGPGDHDQFDLLIRLGADLPGAIIVTPETAVPSSVGPIEVQSIRGVAAPLPEGAVKFSLAGVQLKFSAIADGDRLTAPGRAGEGRCILKVPTKQYPGLPEAEYAAMTVSKMLGIDTANCRLTSTKNIYGIDERLLSEGENALVVDRFDRPGAEQRIHMEDGAQIVGAVGERKYTMATYETMLNMIKRFSTDWRADVLEGFRRMVADVLIGNGDNHLKNWSFIFPAPGVVRLSPAYDIVPTVLFAPGDRLALKMAGTYDFSKVSLHRFRRIADFLELEPDWIEKEIKKSVRIALDNWPDMLRTLLPIKAAENLLYRMNQMPLVAESKS